MSHQMTAWDRLLQFVCRETGWRFIPKPPYPAPYSQDGTSVSVPEMDCEALIHEFCHWVVADKDDRGKLNCGLSDDNDTQSRLFEERAWALETWLFSTVASEADIFSRLTRESQLSHPVHVGGWKHNRASCLLYALQRLMESGIDFEALRVILKAWDSEQRAQQRDSAHASGILEAAKKVREWAPNYAMSEAGIIDVADCLESLASQHTQPTAGQELQAWRDWFRRDLAIEGDYVASDGTCDNPGGDWPKVAAELWGKCSALIADLRATVARLEGERGQMAADALDFAITSAKANDRIATLESELQEARDGRFDVDEIQNAITLDAKKLPRKADSLRDLLLMSREQLQAIAAERSKQGGGGGK